MIAEKGKMLGGTSHSISSTTTCSVEPIFACHVTVVVRSQSGETNCQETVCLPKPITMNEKKHAPLRLTWEAGPKPGNADPIERSDRVISIARYGWPRSSRLLVLILVGRFPLPSCNSICNINGS